MKANNDKKGKKRGGKRTPTINESAGRGERKQDVTFIIVLWMESRELPGEPEWRWRVTEVQSGEEAYFQRMEDLLAYVSEKAGVSPPR